jgi:hypothetical protein
MRYHHTFIEGLFKFAIGEVFVDCAEWRSLLERAIAGATQCMATTTIELRQRLSVGKVIGQNRRSGEDDDENCNRVAHSLTFNAGTDCSAPNIRSYIHDFLAFSFLDPATLGSESFRSSQIRLDSCLGRKLHCTTEKVISRDRTGLSPHSPNGAGSYDRTNDSTARHKVSQSVNS